MPQLIFYGGKGGVGKTTCAAARAAIEAARGARVLVVSTDPAHSLGHALSVRLSPVPRAVSFDSSRRPIATPRRRAGSLHALELNAQRAFAHWLARYRGPLADVLEHGTWLDRSDVDLLLDLPLPGIDELSAMLEVARLAGIEGNLLATIEPGNRPPPSSAAYDIVVVDTAPTGHTLRLLASPEAVGIVARVLDDLQEEHRVIRERFARARRAEAADRLVAMLAGQSRRMAELLRDPKRTGFHWVTLPEMLSVAEAEDGVTTIERWGMHVDEVLVNRVIAPGGRCPVCDVRRRDERRVLAVAARRLASGRRMRIVEEVWDEPRGIKALVRIGQGLIKSVDDAKRPTVVSGSSRTSYALSLPKGAPLVVPESLAPLRGASLLFFAGKGGVGKTTVAAATAVRLARANPDHETLLLSTDPAHSLADVFDVANGVIGDAPRSLLQGPANLKVRELDAVKTLAARRTTLEAALDEIAASFGASAVQHGAELMDLAPPGIDELFGMLSFVDVSGAYQTIAVDMAPTGHALRLLEQPDAARQWVQALIRVLLKYRSLARPGQLAQELVSLSRSIRDLQMLLHDHSRTHVIAVTRAADLPSLQTERLLARLRGLRLSVPLIVVNAMTLAPGRCSRCRHLAAAEQRALAGLKRRCRSRTRRCAIIQTPLSAPAPRGIAALETWGGHWTVGPD